MPLNQNDINIIVEKVQADKRTFYANRGDGHQLE